MTNLTAYSLMLMSAISVFALVDSYQVAAESEGLKEEIKNLRNELVIEKACRLHESYAGLITPIDDGLCFKVVYPAFDV